jgi:hypothetical protein
MLKVIKINTIEGDLTVDSDIITVDTTLITVDATIGGNNYQIKIPYRFFSSEIKMVLWNEIRELETILELECNEQDGLMVIDFYFDFVDGETFEVKVVDLQDKLIWRGKFLATIQTDLENYILHKNDNGIIKI